MAGKKIRNQAEFLKAVINARKFLKEGEKVRINADGIKARKAYEHFRQDYKDFIEANKDKVFTVQYDEAHTEYPTLVCLAEDTTEPKVLFSEQDLLRVVDGTE